MFNWAKQQLANVAGTQEPIYGASAIRSVAEEARTKPYTEIDRRDLTWKDMDTTNVESKSFYLFSDNGDIALAQVIHSNVAGIRRTSQFNSKIFSKDPSTPHLWCSTPLHNVDFSEDKTSLYADDCAVELSEDGNSYTIKSMTDERSIVNVKVTKAAPGFQAGETGLTKYGTDLENPWGTMRHAFLPRCVVEGTITTKDGPIDFKGRAMVSYALQGMKPHHAAARWTFANFQGPNYSAIHMSFTTPPSYGSTTVNVGGILKDGQIITASCANEAIHTTAKDDPENEWPEPTHIKFIWAGKGDDDKPIEAEIDADLGDRVDKVDVMAEVPAFVKKIVAGTVGTKPYIYQFTPKVTLKLKIGDKEILEEGQLLTEATFISE
ncbi:survival factor 1 [Drechmeria coniospora]|uniref:Survival factor 1 n=1 Tax=Drechmeria coniospora TaxID=98403 RepID=A0A151GQN7_DRECN|nr:survival factor 1 [Drechmeria coniospora]KYK59378.1 survival factor 1 [Drechmeria coniospora]ODA76375.1 hypothetical protein RJ55_08221 [Drechmeria coniospora]